MPSRPHFPRVFSMHTILPAGLVLTAFIASLSACAQQTGPLPAPGTVRVVARKVQNDHNKVEWQWTIIGERNWSATRTNSQGEVELSEADAAFKPKSANVYDLWIQVRSGTDPAQKPRIFTSTIFGQRPVVFEGAGMKIQQGGGQPAKGNGEEPLLATVATDKTAKVLFTSDKVLKLPVKVPLYERTYGLDGTGKVNRQIYYLIIGK